MVAVAAASISEDEQFRVATDGDEVLVEYKGMLTDGTVFDASEERGPLSFKVGAGQVVPGFEAAVRGMKVGDKITATLSPEEAYGKKNEDLIITASKEQAPAGLEEGMRVMLGGGAQKVPATVAEIKADGSVVLDANPPLAGRTLVFEIELVGFKEPPQLGLEMAGWQGVQIHIPNAISNSPVSKVFDTPSWPEAWPYIAGDFRRQDETDDRGFYDAPRLVTHIDDGAIGAIRSFYEVQFAQVPEDELCILDMCSSWVSHYPANLKAKRVSITGMVETELAENKQATDYSVKDLNKDPVLPYSDCEFDFVTNVVSVDYLNKPREIFSEMHRVLKPGGVAIMSFSNRCFPNKAIAMWIANMNDGPGHCQIIGNYFHFNPSGGWKNISSADISPNPGKSDPMWVVTAVKA